MIKDGKSFLLQSCILPDWAICLNASGLNACLYILARGNDISFRPVGFFDLHSGLSQNRLISFDSRRISEARPYSS